MPTQSGLNVVRPPAHTESVPIGYRTEMDSAAVQLSPMWQRGLQQAIEQLRSQHPGIGVKKLIEELRKQEAYACASSKLVRSIIAALDRRAALLEGPKPESQFPEPGAAPKAAVENRAARRARMKSAKKAAKKQGKALAAKGAQRGTGKSGGRSLSKKDMWLLQSVTSMDSGGSPADGQEQAVAAALVDTADAKEMRARLETYQMEEKQMGLLHPNTVLQLKAYNSEKWVHYAEVKKRMQRKWTLNSAILHERVKDIDDNRYEAAVQNCKRLMAEKEEYDSSVAALIYWQASVSIVYAARFD
jgi:hypothetical protein